MAALSYYNGLTFFGRSAYCVKLVQLCLPFSSKA